MTYSSFKEIIKKNLFDFLGEEYQDWEIKESSVLKINEKMEGFTLVAPDQTEGIAVMPMMYYEVLYNMYKIGIPLEQILKDTAESMVSKDNRNRITNPDILKSFDTCKYNIVLEIISKEVNMELLEEYVHRDYLDMAVVYRIIVEDNDDHRMSTLLTKDIFDSWNIAEEELYRNAYRNTAEKRGFTLMSLDTMGIISEDTKPMSLILTNQDMERGAAAMMYPMMLERAARLLEDDFYILPSSLNELFLVAAEDADSERLKEAVRAANATIVAQQDFLSDSLYFYGRETKEVKIA